ncbi:NAD(P)-dependent dehydrogenase (short-subunit alcohol dehydrogenase family) [Deinococcus metalli]|uniref:NAD(P)-dependent dehydrogenase (Short-subunit alcohol dehydrogenase family) n=1 Tax=Deinococcus metalli TaxID=1141878 RepID=A0A7W8KEP7_9DEIO|nr:glucose 1-dehydrogenase [Deinococcus metalli]MBB5376810.1 NAD(P)-dependent dehydrogenase (short-subunit alcohol dehydrogenase family) [Deinococcus metalli]GHF45517.1 short-chain dehydrogenase/reductase [Deinococcus metalli]
MKDTGGATFDFRQRRALVTGAGKGIGREIAAFLAGCGAQVVAVSRSADDLAALERDHGCMPVVADLADVQGARDAVRAAGPVDLLVNNAGISVLQPFLDVTPDAFDRTVAVNVRAALIVSQEVARGLIARGAPGAIVNVSSQASTVGLPEHAAYCASKGALDQLTRVMAIELGPHGIRVNAVNPTVTMTPMGRMAWGDPTRSAPMLARIPLGRFAEPLDVAHTVAYLLSDSAGMIHGATLPVDGGFLAT